MKAPGNEIHGHSEGGASQAQPLSEALRHGRISRRLFIARATAFGFSGAAINALLIACGGDTSPTNTAAPAAATTAPTRAATATGATGAATAARTATGATGAATAARTATTAVAATATRAASPAAGATATRTATAATATRTSSPAVAATYTRDNPPAVTNAAQARQFSGQRVTFIGGQVGSDNDFDQILTRKFQQDTGIQINLIPGPESATDRFAQYQRAFQAQSTDIDVVMVDVIWPAAFANNLADLNPKLGDLARQAFPAIVENNTVDGKLVGMPWFGDFGVLYYRTDLLRKYNISAPPRTWQELQQQADTIQNGERGANPNFVGFVFQGAAYEGLTCNALEWFASTGAGQFIEGGANNARRQVTINNPAAVQTLNLIKGYVGTISPRGVTNYREEDARNVFQGGNAAFMRNWPYAYALGNAAQSPIRGQFDVAPLPTSQGQQPVGTLGGWQLGVSRYSRAQDAAIEFIRYMCGPDVVTWRAVVGSYVPLYPSVSDNPVVQQNQPYLARLANVQRVTRPSNQLGEQYNEGSTVIFQAVNNVLTGQDAAGQLQQAEQRLTRLVR